MGLISGDCAGQSRRVILWSSIHFLAFLEVCLGSLSCWKITSSSEITHSFRLGSMWSSKMDTYWSASIFPSTSARWPTPFHPIQPHTMMFPPPNLTVPCTSLSISPSPACFHTHSLPSDPNLLILVSSDQITLFQSSTVHSLYFWAKANLAFLCLPLSKGFFFFTTALNECFFKTLLIVCEETGWEIMVLMCFMA